MSPAKQPRLPGWRSAEGRAAFVAAYDAALELWSAPAESREIPTRFGPTHALVSGPAEGSPLLLLHAAFGIGALQWFANAGRLAKQHRVYALDFVGAPGKGAQTRPILDRGDCAGWLADVLDALELERADLLGSSQGGWLALNLAVSEPARVRALALLAPAASFLPLRRRIVVGLRCGRLMPGWLAGPSMRACFGDRYRIDPRMTHVLAMSLKHFRYQQRAVYPDVFSDAELRQVQAATLLILGDKEIIYAPEAALERAARLVPRIETEFISDAGHLLNIEQAERVDRRMLDFLGRARDQR